MLILGINEGADASVVIMRDGRAVFALQEERVRRRKGFAGFPQQALAFALNHLDLQAGDFDALALAGLTSPAPTDPAFANLAQYRFHHHANHAASAYYGMRADARSPHLVLTLDEGGDGACSRVYVTENGALRLVAETAGEDSLGHIYSRVTHRMGMTPQADEYKLMGLAPYADADHYQAPLECFRSYLDLDPADPLRFKRKTREGTADIDARLARDLERVRFDALAGAVQAFTEELVVKWVRACVAKTGIHKVVAAGGVFMNVKANKRIAALPEIDYFDVFPSAGDETLAFGAAWQASLAQDRGLNEVIAFDDFCLGPDASLDLDAAMTRFKGMLAFERLDDPAEAVAELLSQGHIVARCDGPMEFGARALGNRSLLADAANPQVATRINKAIKQRDFWMPFAPAAVAERAGDYVSLPASLPRPRLSPYMMHAFDTTVRRDEFIAATHPYDGTARLQTVSAGLNPGFHAVLSKFAARTGRAILLNTSFNLHGHPIVMGATDAMDVMTRSGIGHLVIGDMLVTKRAA